MKYFIFLLASFNSFCNSKDSKPDELNAKTTQIVEKTDPANEETIVLGGGCFWCLEAVYQDLNGVTKVESGYSNGQVDNPTYKQVCSGLTGHAEVVKLTFDNKKVSLNDILDVFWTIHDPTTLNRQGNDSGPQYRSGIYYFNEAQKKIAENSIKTSAQEIWGDRITTEVLPVSKFSVAEDYHQNYYNENSNESYCRFIITPKVEKFRKKFADKLKSNQKSTEMESVPKWNELTSAEARVIEDKGTEYPGTGKYYKSTGNGVYECRRCNAPLYDSKDKFQSDCGWPAFDDEIEGSVERIPDADGSRTEIVCANCKAHLGHVFEGERLTSKDTRHCVNSISLQFLTREEYEKQQLALKNNN